MKVRVGLPIIGFALAGVVVVVALVPAGCRLWWTANNNPWLSFFNISVHGRMVEVTGDTDLPDGARLDITAVRDCDLTCVTKVTSVVVGGGSYATTFDLAGWPAGSDVIWVEFNPAHDQLSAIQRKYGVDGSKMFGASIRHLPDESGWEWFGDLDFRLQ